MDEAAPDDARKALAARPQVSRLLETSLYVTDLERSRDFYARIFGFPVFFTDDRMSALEIPGGGVLLLFKRDGSLQPSPTPGGVIPPHGGNGQLHLCFAVPLASLDAWSAHLAAESVPLESRVQQFFGGISLYFRDPDGHSVEVAGPGLWPSF